MAEFDSLLEDQYPQFADAWTKAKADGEYDRLLAGMETQPSPEAMYEWLLEQGLNCLEFEDFCSLYNNLGAAEVLRQTVVDLNAERFGSAMLEFKRVRDDLAAEFFERRISQAGMDRHQASLDIADELIARQIPNLRRCIAVHEAGHAVVNLALGTQFSEVAMHPSSVMINGEMCDGAVYVDQSVKYPALQIAIGAIAGSAAEAKYRKTRLISTVLVCAGADYRTVKDSLAASDFSYELVEQGARKLVDLYWSEILSVADALMLHGTLTQEDVARLAPSACNLKEAELYVLLARVELRRREKMAAQPLPLTKEICYD